MNVSWLIETYGDPLGMVQNVIVVAWERFNLDMMLVSADGSSEPHLIFDSAEIFHINPFKPLMTKNSAKSLQEVLTDHPDSAIGLLMRPCEMRALKGKTARESLPLSNILTICVDCLGTYPLEDYKWRAERKGTPEQLAWESLHFARQGGIAKYRFRSACQVCRNPISQGADVNIGVIGLPVRQKILIDARNQDIADLIFRQDSSSAGDISLLNQRDHIVAKLLQRSSYTRHRIQENMKGVLPKDLNALLDHFVGCGKCRECLEVCPICTADFPRKGDQGKYISGDVEQWMVLCAGCGMCEQACPNHEPLVAMFSNIREQLIDSSELSTMIH